MKKFFTVGYPAAERGSGWHQMVARWGDSPEEVAEWWMAEMGGPHCEVHCQNGDRVTYVEYSDGYPDLEVPIDRHIMKLNTLSLLGDVQQGYSLNEPML